MKYLALITFTMAFGQICAATSIWEGEINSNGTPTEMVKLSLGKKYTVKVSGVVNTNKWHQGSAALGEDACFDFGDQVNPQPNELVKNSLNIDICADKQFHPDHIYESEPFEAKKNGIHFWVDDDDYTDNHGSFKAQIFEK